MSSSMDGRERDVTVVQYFESSVSDKLLCKFPDNSAFDFDYSQSALWSPPIRRFHHLYFAGGQILTPARRLSLDSERRRRRKKKITLSKIKTKIHGLALNFNLPSRRLKFNGSNDNTSHSPTTKTKGWEKVLKIASKQFKRKKKEPTAHVQLSDYLRSQNF